MRIVIASDLHYCVDPDEEIQSLLPLLPPSFFDHMIQNGNIWHNRMLLDDSECIVQFLQEMILREKADLCILLGDIVNTNCEKNVVAVTKKLQNFPCPLRYILGNHDLYLPGDNTQLETFLPHANGKEGARYEIFDNIGFLYLDIFIQHADGRFDRTYIPGESQWLVSYRPLDLQKAEMVLAQNPDVNFILFSHMQVLPVRELIYQPGRKIADHCGDLSRFADLLLSDSNLVAAISGHNHLASFDDRGNGFQWILPSLIEYPCAAAVLDIDKNGIYGKCLPIDKTLMKKSFVGQAWTYGTERDRNIQWPRLD